MSNQEEINKVEMSIEEARLAIARKTALLRLEQNADFKTIVLDGFMKDHAVTQVMLKAHPTMQTEAAQKLLEAQLVAIGNLKQFFIGIYVKGDNAAMALADDEITLEALHQEDLDKG